MIFVVNKVINEHRIPTFVLKKTFWTTWYYLAGK